MAATSPQEVTGLLLAWSEGKEAAFEKLVPLVYAELRRVAHRYMGRERPGHSLQTTALVNEAFGQNFYGDIALELGVVRPIYLTHPACTKQREDLIRAESLS